MVGEVVELGFSGQGTSLRTPVFFGRWREAEGKAKKGRRQKEGEGKAVYSLGG